MFTREETESACPLRLWCTVNEVINHQIDAVHLHAKLRCAGSSCVAYDSGSSGTMLSVQASDRACACHRCRAPATGPPPWAQFGKMARPADGFRPAECGCERGRRRRDVKHIAASRMIPRRRRIGPPLSTPVALALGVVATTKHHHPTGPPRRMPKTVGRARG
jgi:hypothetical protein